MTKREGYGNYLVSTYSPLEFKKYLRIFDEYYIDYESGVRKSSSGNRLIYIIRAFNEPDYILREIRQKIKEVHIPDTVIRRAY